MECIHGSFCICILLQVQGIYDRCNTMLRYCIMHNLKYYVLIFFRPKQVFCPLVWVTFLYGISVFVVGCK